MRKPAILNSYLGKEGTTVSATVHQTGAEREKDRGHTEKEREVVVGRLFFIQKKKGTFFGHLYTNNMQKSCHLKVI